jgi:hypothetical protein
VTRRPVACRFCDIRYVPGTYSAHVRRYHRNLPKPTDVDGSSTRANLAVHADAEDTRPRCAEWTRRGRCGNPARYLARDGRTPDGPWTPLCGIHANVDRWANYVDTEYRELMR